jgi:hypothetical protein
MALLELVLGGPRRAKIGVVTLDASVEEVHRKTNVVTDHPVEEGVNIVDHIRRLPDEITISGVITDTPLYIAPSLFAPNPVDNRASTLDRVGQGYDRLERMMEEAELVDVVTTFKEYENMALASLEVTRNAANGNVMNARMGLRQVKTAVAEELSLPKPEDPSNEAVDDGGKKPTAPGNEQQTTQTTDQSVIYDAIGLAKFPGT